MPTVTRRHLLSVFGASALCPARQRKVLVAAHPWVYAATRPKYDIYDILDRIFEDMSQSGMEGIELMHTAVAPDGAVERIRTLSERYRLPVIGTSYSAEMWDAGRHDAIFQEGTEAIRRLSRVGGRTFGATVGNAGKPKTPAQLDAQAAILRKLIAACNDHGVVLNLHNHTYELTDNEHDLRGTLERIPDVKLGPDFDWVLRAGVDPVDFIHRHGKKIVYAHLRDQKADGKWSEAMGEGSMDYAAIGRALRAVGFSGDVAIELAYEGNFQPTRPLRESLKLSRQYVRRTMGY